MQVEYRTVFAGVESLTDEWLNRQGADRWQLVTAVPDDKVAPGVPTLRLVFMRRVVAVHVPEPDCEGST